eukprot:m.552991 g.552991  ORF g.552991 m.552991 type:complete len:365 (+) comp57742_c0_seq8:355-1449(+)
MGRDRQRKSRPLNGESHTERASAINDARHNRKRLRVSAERMVRPQISRYCRRDESVRAIYKRTREEQKSDAGVDALPTILTVEVQRCNGDVEHGDASDGGRVEAISEITSENAPENAANIEQRRKVCRICVAQIFSVDGCVLHVVRQPIQERVADQLREEKRNGKRHDTRNEQRLPDGDWPVVSRLRCKQWGSGLRTRELVFGSEHRHAMALIRPRGSGGWMLGFGQIGKPDVVRVDCNAGEDEEGHQKHDERRDEEGPAPVDGKHCCGDDGTQNVPHIEIRVPDAHYQSALSLWKPVSHDPNHAWPTRRLVRTRNELNNDEVPQCVDVREIGESQHATHEQAAQHSSREVKSEVRPLRQLSAA